MSPLSRTTIWWIGAMTAAGTVALVHGPLLGAGPTLELFEGPAVARPAFENARLLAASLDGIAGLATALALALLPRLRRSVGWFGALAAAALAVAASFWCRAASDQLPVWLPPLTGAVLATAVSPALRDRGIVSLAVATAAVGVVVVLARREVLGVAGQAELLRSVLEVLWQQGDPRQVVTVAPDVAPDTRRAFALAAWHSDPTRRIGVLIAPYETAASIALREGGLRGVRIEPGRITHLEPIPAADAALQLDAGWADGELAIRLPELPPAVAVTITIATPVEAIEHPATPGKGWVDLGEHRDRLRAIRAALPPDMPFGVRARTDLGGFTSRWTWLPAQS